MAFEPLEFTDELDPLGPPANPKTATPVDAENLKKLQEGLAAYTDSSVKVLKEAPINVEYPEYGADGTGVADSTAAFKSAIAALPATGGGIFAPRRYKLSEGLSAEGKRAVKVFGVAGLSAGAEPASLLKFTQAGSSPLINARSTGGFVWEDLGILYTSGSFTGPIFDFSHGESGFDAAFGNIERSLIGGQEVRTALCVDLDKAIDTNIRGCNFTNYDIAVRGQKEKGRYSNSITLDGCTFGGGTTVPLKNAGEAWRVVGCTFENLHSGHAAAYLSDSEVLAAGLTFDTCWFGDATEAEGTWITFRGSALTVRGGSLGSGALGISVPDTASDNLTVLGVRFTSITDAIRANFGAGTQRYVIGANGYVSVGGKKVSLDNGSTDAGAGFLSH